MNLIYLKILFKRLLKKNLSKPKEERILSSKNIWDSYVLNIVES